MLVKLLIAIFAVYNLSAEAPTASRSPKLSFPAKASERTILFYLGYPKMKFNAKGNLDLSMKTRVPSIAGSLYYGHFHPHQNFPVPRYRYHLKEKISPKGTEKALNHHFQIPFGGKSSKSPEKKKYDAPGVRHQGGVIPLRFEYYNPRKQASELFETSFRYYKNSTGKRSIEPHIIAGPYFDTPGAGQVSISFQMDRPIAGRVILRRKGAAKTQAYGFKASMHPEIHIEGLTEGGRYTYQVQIPNPDHGNGGSYYSYPETEIRVPGSDFKPFSFACMSDSRAGHGGGEFNIQGTNTRSIKKLMRAAYDRGADFIFFPGDLIDGYTTIKEDFEQQLMAWKKAVSPVHRRIPIFEGMGNHEALMKRYVVDREAPIQPLKYGSFSISDPENPPEEIFASHFVNPENGPKSEGFDSPPYGETVYSVVLNGVGFIMINTNYWYVSDPETLGGNLEGYVMDRQMAWIEKQIKAWDQNPRVRYAFLFGHEPSFPNSVHYKDAMYYSGGLPEKNGGFDRAFVIKRRDRFWRALSSSPKMVFAMFGDEHNYSRTLIPENQKKGFKYPVWQLISGGVGAPYYSDVTNLPWSSQVRFIDWKQNFLHISVKRDGVWLQALSSTGEIMESVKLRDAKDS